MNEQNENEVAIRTGINAGDGGQLFGSGGATGGAGDDTGTFGGGAGKSSGQVAGSGN